MTELGPIIEARRYAVKELDLLRNAIGEKYGKNPPVEVLKALAELSKNHLSKFGRSPKIKGKSA